MPIIPPTNTPPYPTAEYILNLARTICLDAGISLGGNLLSDTATYTGTILEASYESIQDEIANKGYETPMSETILTNVPAMPSAIQQPGAQVWLGYDGFFDGQTLNAAPVLPQDMIIPVRMQERITATKARFQPMTQANDGLPQRQQYAYMQQWDWRDDRIYMVGAVDALDLWIRYQCTYPSLIDAYNNVIPAAKVKIFHGAVAMAYDIAYRFSGPRDGAVAVMMKAERDEAVRQIIVRTSHKTMRKNARRMPYSGYNTNFNYGGY